MNKLTILVGPPGSGKSTYAKQLEAQGFVRISQDDQGREGHMEMFQSHICTGVDIIIDRMNFDRSQRDKYRLEAVKNGYTVNFVEFCVPRKVCLQRCIARTGHPTITEEKHAENALTTYFSKYEPVSEEEGSVEFKSYQFHMKWDAIMCDLDGTLANLDHRLHYVRGEGKKDWGSFFRECRNDGLYECVARIVKMEHQNNTKIVYCSGRDEEQCRELTVDWLKKHNLFFGNDVIMRPKKNYKRDDITKIMLYRYEIEPYYNVKYVLDDRNQVVEAWRNLGLVCLQVRPGEF